MNRNLYKAAEIVRLERLFASQGRPCYVSWPNNQPYELIDFWRIDRHKEIVMAQFTHKMPPANPRPTPLAKINWAAKFARLREWQHARRCGLVPAHLTFADWKLAADIQ